MTETTLNHNDLKLRGKPRLAKRFNRNALIAIVGAGALLILGSLSIAFKDDEPSKAQTQTELHNTTNRILPPKFASLPTTYAEVQSRRLGPPLPGDIGLAIAGTPAQLPPTDNPFRYQGVAPVPISQESVRSVPAQTQSLPEDSPLFFIQNQRNIADTMTTDTPSLQSSGLNQLAELTLPNQLPEITQSQILDDPNQQGRKEAFLGGDVDPEIYNPHRIQTPVSPFQVMAGTIIPASLVTGLNSDLPGQVIAQVTEHVFDTPTGEHLLIPQGSRLIGRYDSVIAFGQSRALVAWNRIIMPDGTSMTLENLPGADLAGFAGLNDRVDNHKFKIFQAAILSSILSIASELGRDTNDSDLLEALRDGGQRTLNQAGQQIVQRQLNVQPTIRVRPGHRLRVIVNKDLILQPYGA